MWDAAFLALTLVGISAAMVFNAVYFAFVLPHARRRRGRKAFVEASLSLIAGQLRDYVKMAKHGRLTDRIVALALRWSIGVAITCMAALIILAFVRTLTG